MHEARCLDGVTFDLVLLDLCTWMESALRYREQQRPNHTLGCVFVVCHGNYAD